MLLQRGKAQTMKWTGRRKILFGTAMLIAIGTGGFLALRLTEKTWVLAAEAVAAVDASGPVWPVPKDILDFNDRRKAAGLVEVGADWVVLTCRVFVMDGPQIRVLANGKRTPSKVILGPRTGWGSIPAIIQEYEVVDGRLNGKAVTWYGTPPLVYTLESYRNSVHESTEYLDQNGTVIATCTFRNERPWTGRHLDRNGFQILWDVSYLDGKLDGPEWHYEGLKTDRRTFRKGIEHGLRQHFWAGRLTSEFDCENGLPVRARGYDYETGKLRSEGVFPPPQSQPATPSRR